MGGTYGAVIGFTIMLWYGIISNKGVMNMANEIVFSLRLNKKTFRKFILQIVGMGLFIAMGSVLFISYYKFYIMGLAAIFVTTALYGVFKSQKNTVVMNEESITVRKTNYNYSDYKLFAKDYKGTIIDILAQANNKKNKIIVLRLNGLELDKNKFLMSLKSFVHVEIEKR